MIDIALDPVITGEVVPNTQRTWMTVCAIAGNILGSLAIIGVLAFTIALDDSDMPTWKRRMSWVGLLIALFGGYTMGGFGMYQVASHEGSDTREIDEDALIAAIEDRYTIETIRGIEGIDDVGGLCSPVSPDSPELTGVTDGQQISFKVGTPHCQEPVARIIVTETPGQAITADQLEQGS